MFFVLGLLAFLALAAHEAVQAAQTKETPAAGALDTDASEKRQLPLMPKDPDSIKGQIEMKVESGLITYGPILLFALLFGSGFGLALGEDIFIIPAGFLMQQGVMSVWGTIAAAYFGVVLADTLWVIIVRRFSGRILRFKFFRRMFHPRRILEVKYKFDRWGAWVVVASRFIPFSRTPVFTAAGLTKMSLWKFFFAEAISAIPVVGMQLGFGWLLGMGYERSEKSKQIEEVILFSVIGLVVVALAWYWWRRKKSKIRAPRAPASWLREAIRRTSPKKA
tara:strand:+ start:955 stop:1788 length:834 start_codon:yes stop_codon:yes gene_type:complete